MPIVASLETVQEVEAAEPADADAPGHESSAAEVLAVPGVEPQEEAELHTEQGHAAGALL